MMSKEKEKENVVRLEKERKRSNGMCSRPLGEIKIEIMMIIKSSSAFSLEALTPSLRM